MVTTVESGRSWGSDAPLNVATLFAQAAAQNPDGYALLIADERRTYRDLLVEVEQLASGLVATGVAPGDRVCLFAPNLPEAYTALLATAKCGAVFVPVNPRLTERELRHVLDTSDAKTLLFIPAFSGIDYIARLKGLYPQLVGEPPDDRFGAHTLIALRGEALGALRYSDVLALGDDDEHRGRVASVEAEIRSADPVMLQFTSGTTSLPKAALVAHGPTARMSFELAERFGLTSEDRYFGCPPICHLGGTTFSFLAVMSHAATFVTLPAYDAGAALNLMARERCTVDHGIDSHLRLQLNHPDFDPARLALRLVSVSAVSQTVQDVARAFGGPAVISQYGSTETGGAPICTAFDDPIDKRHGTAGRPLPDVVLRIVNTETEAEVLTGVIGEIRIGGWSLMVGYLNQPEENAALLDEAGMMKTGDLGFVDAEGFLHFTGRVKNMLRSGGENISIEEVETVITNYDGADLAIVVGVPDEVLGEVPFAFVVTEQGAQVVIDELRAYCATQLARFKVPKQFVECSPDSLPMTGTGKIDRRALQERAASMVRTG